MRLGATGGSRRRCRKLSSAPKPWIEPWAMGDAWLIGTQGEKSRLAGQNQQVGSRGSGFLRSSGNRAGTYATLPAQIVPNAKRGWRVQQKKPAGLGGPSLGSLFLEIGASCPTGLPATRPIGSLVLQGSTKRTESSRASQWHFFWAGPVRPPGSGRGWGDFLFP